MEFVLFAMFSGYKHDDKKDDSDEKDKDDPEDGDEKAVGESDDVIGGQ